MSDTLIKVNKGQSSQSLMLDTSAKLNAVRQTLSSPPISMMGAGDSFLNSGSPVAQGMESLIQLSALTGSTNTLSIGTGADIGGNDSVQRYNQLSEPSKRALFDNLQIRRGLSMDNTGMVKTFKDLYDWKLGALPDANMPRVLNEVEQDYTFTEQTKTLQTTGVQSGSLSLTTPYGGGSANYEYAKSHSTSSSETTMYMTARYLSNKVDLNVSLSNIQGNTAFIAAVKSAVTGHENDITGYQNLVNVLNEWGWYIPVQYTLGGAVFATKQSQISKFSEADEESQKFGGEFKGAFDGIGGGAAYENSSGTKSTSSTSTEHSSVQLQQIGGRAGTSGSYKDWNDSLNDAVTWNTTKFQKLYPSLMLLSGVANDTLGTCDALLQKYNSYTQVKSLQPYIDVKGYELGLAALLNPFR